MFHINLILQGKSSFNFAFVLDFNQEEKIRGITMDTCLRFFETSKKLITILDSPGHRDFIPNMISGTIQTESAILVINSSLNEFEIGFRENAQTKEHVRLIYSLGVKHIIIAINKMDIIAWKQTRYNKISNELKIFFTNMSLNLKKYTYIPISGFSNQNLIESYFDNNWYLGPTLIDLINKLKKTKILFNKPFRLSISDIYQNQILGNTILGKVLQGFVLSGDKIYIRSSGVLTKIKNF